MKKQGRVKGTQLEFNGGSVPQVVSLNDVENLILPTNRNDQVLYLRTVEKKNVAILTFWYTWDTINDLSDYSIAMVIQTWVKFRSTIY